MPLLSAESRIFRFDADYRKILGSGLEISVYLIERGSNLTGNVVNDSVVICTVGVATASSFDHTDFADAA